MIKNFLKNKRGFTLMEVMVSVSIFTIVVTVGIGSLLMINNAYQKAQSDRQAIDSLTYTLESMSRRIRTAREWGDSGFVISYNAGALGSFVILDQDGVSVTYQLTGSKITIQDPTGSVPYDMTPDSVTITGLSFLPLQTRPGGQEYVQINIKGSVVSGRQNNDFNLQTGISKRTFK
jgi:prepilin-type N-terminal cleavage/methylation domain-containing protein